MRWIGEIVMIVRRLRDLPALFYNVFLSAPEYHSIVGRIIRVPRSNSVDKGEINVIFKAILWVQGTGFMYSVLHFSQRNANLQML